LNISLLDDVVEDELNSHISTQTHSNELCVDKTTAFNYTDQRSFGCQTNGNQTIEAASQTFQQFLDQHQEHLQQQQEILDMNYDINCFDASTSPLNIDLLDDVLFCNDISTQTCSGLFPQQTNNRHYNMLQQSDMEPLSTAVAHTQTKLIENYSSGMQTNDLDLFATI
jgi:hypothetical protein